MSTVFDIVQQCSVCGHKAPIKILLSTSSFGSPDLDTRPAPLARMAIGFCVNRCPNCGFVAGELEKETKATKMWLEEFAIPKSKSLHFTSNLAEDYFLAYLIDQLDNDSNNAFYHALSAAWVCDDHTDCVNATVCRLLAYAELDKVDANIIDQESKVLLKADLLRRSSWFEDAITLLQGTSFNDEKNEKIKLFQILKCKEYDDECYRVSDALES